MIINNHNHNKIVIHKDMGNQMIRSYFSNKKNSRRQIIIEKIISSKLSLSKITKSQIIRIRKESST